MSLVAAGPGAGGLGDSTGGLDALKSGDDENKIGMWMSPALISGYLVFLFLFIIAYNAFLALGAI